MIATPANSSAAPLAASLTPAEAICSLGTCRINAAVKEFGIPKTDLYRLMQSGKLCFSKQGRARLIPRLALIQLVAEGLKGDPARLLGDERASA